MAKIQNSFDFSPIRNVVLKEYNKWQKGKLKESEPDAAPMLTKYWAYIGTNYTTTKQFTSVPWSAAYVSWIMSQVVGDFPKSSAHRNYAKAGWRNRKNKAYGWTLYSLSREKDKIIAQPGDVLVKPRGKGRQEGEQDGDAKYLATHSDIVWSIKEGKAYLAGGNLGDTNRIYDYVRLNSDGSYPKNPKGSWDKVEYLVALKKM